MFARIALSLLFASIGAAIAAVFTLITAAFSFLIGTYLGEKWANEKTEETPES